MSTSCIDSILCENAWDCNITVLDTQGNPIDPLTLHTGDAVVFALGEKPGYIFNGWRDENNNVVNYTQLPLGENYYQINQIDCSKQYYAVYTPIQYRITIQSNPPDICFNTIVRTATYGSIETITANDSLGCRFVNWTKDGEVMTYERSFDYVVTGNVTFVANYDSMWYTITAKPNNRNRGRCTGSGTYALNDNVQLTAQANEGYSFTSWDDGVTTANRNITVTGSKTYVANFITENNAVVSHNVSGGSTIGSGEYSTGSVVTLQAVPDPGWRFSYWTINGVRVDDETYSFVTSRNIDAIPFFEPETYEVRLYPSPLNTGYFTPQPVVQHSYGDTFTVTATPYVGYRFVEWSDGFSSPSRTFTVTSDIELNAVFAEAATEQMVTVVLPDNTYTCQIIYNGVNIGTQIGNEVVANGVEGSLFTIVPSVPDGQTIVSVTEGSTVIWDNTSRGSITYTVGNSDTELTVNYQSLKYQLRVTASPLNTTTSGNINLSLTIDETTTTFAPTIQNSVRLYNNLDYDTSVSLTAPSTVGDYEFAYWTSPNGSYNTNTITFNLNSTSECVAVYYDSTLAPVEEENDE